jgi:hypothetical protein
LFPFPSGGYRQRPSEKAPTPQGERICAVYEHWGWKVNCSGDVADILDLRGGGSSAKISTKIETRQRPEDEDDRRHDDRVALRAGKGEESD